jgi:hypothetical protein
VDSPERDAKTVWRLCIPEGNVTQDYGGDIGSSSFGFQQKTKTLNRH